MANPYPRDETLHLPERTETIKTWWGLGSRVRRLDSRSIRVTLDHAANLMVRLKTFSHSESEFADMLDTCHLKIDIKLSRLFV